MALTLAAPVGGALAATRRAGATEPAPKLFLSINATPARVKLVKNAPATQVAIMGLTTEQLTILFSDETFASSCDARISLSDPDGNLMVGPKCAGTPGSFGVASLPSSGEYTLTMSASATGSLHLEARSGGGPESITPDAPAENVRVGNLGFTARAGERYSVVMTGGALIHGRCTVFLDFADSAGVQVGPYSATCNRAGDFLDATTIPSDGTYFVQLQRSSTDSRYLAVRLYKVPADQTGVIRTGGVPLDVNITTPGQHAAFTFQGFVGNRVSFLVTGDLGTSLTVLRPDGTQAETGGPTTGGYLEPFALDLAGTWMIVVDPPGPRGTATLQRWTVVDQTGTADLSGAPIELNLVPGQNAAYSFNGVTGQRVSVYLSAINAICRCGACWNVALVRPDGSDAQTACAPTNESSSGTAFIPPFVLDQGGTWSVTVDPAIGLHGTASLQIGNVVDKTGSIALNTPVSVVLPVPGQDASFTFSGASGEKLLVPIAASSISSCRLSILRPDGSVFEGEYCPAPTAPKNPRTLDATGTWTARINPLGPATGSLNFEVDDFVDQTGSITPGGPSVALNLSTPYQNAEYTFSGTTGDARTVSLASSTFPGCSSLFVSLLRPDGTTLALKGTCGATLTLGPSTLDASGTWTIFVDPQGAGTGTATLSLT